MCGSERGEWGDVLRDGARTDPAGPVRFAPISSVSVIDDVFVGTEPYAVREVQGKE